jgi:hypothetical protein
MIHWRILLSVAFFGAVPFGVVETQAAENPWDVAASEFCDWSQYHSFGSFPDLPMPVIGVGRCSRERLRTACRLAVRGAAPLQGLKLCPAELCPTIGRALIGLGPAVISGGQLITVYRLCSQQLGY